MYGDRETLGQRVKSRAYNAAWKTKLALKTAKHYTGQAGWRVHDYFKYNRRGRSEYKPPRHPDDRYPYQEVININPVTRTVQRSFQPVNLHAGMKINRNAQRMQRKMKVKRFFGLLRD